jgi:16S rRNA A1518/A1519 N6-dimethyltransferase RsmA/KsgA/DIM1 with predicted DNA glycosylase/AP lyase activity
MNDRQLLELHGISPKKSLGQNFLHDPNTLEKIVVSAELSPDATVLEIGSGTGNLTEVLAYHAARVIAVELDDRLIPLLRQRFEQRPDVEVVHGDILTSIWRTGWAAADRCLYSGGECPYYHHQRDFTPHFRKPCRAIASY